MKLLVAGGDPVDAGKTTFAVGLAARLRADGSRPTVFKPRAGNDRWFDHDDVRRAAGDGRLYGKDIDRLLRAAGGDATHERRNPIHRLWGPTPGETGLLGESDRTFLVDRVRTTDGDEWVVNGTTEIPDALRDDLPLVEARRVDSVRAFNEAMRELHLPALDRLAEDVRAAGGSGVALVESYGDVAMPLREVGFDAVAVVDPGRCRVYDGDRWALARETATGDRDEGTLEVHVDRVTGMLDPLSTRDLRPLTGEERDDPDVVASAYSAAYDELLAAAQDR
ncbi:ATPase [Halobaculum sp. WSA2]|uniref:ATPase n=1 Tax=Halobaculum saliterrae TaxID=2073113 RepID=A0A6B0SW18_9EURY|nr:ATPase [Halobaculum saliterrae]MXR40861.1 ATPase [Halobaculum saliterrae]